METMNIFNGEKIYGKDSWQEVARRPLNASEKKMMINAECRQGDYQKSCCFFLVTGGSIYFPFSRDAQDKVNINQKFSLDELEVVILEKNEQKITRIDLIEK